MSSVYPCVVCESLVRARQEALQCDSCDRWQHRTCNSGITRQQYREMNKGNLSVTWWCTACGNSPPVANSTALSDQSFQPDQLDQSDQSDQSEPLDQSDQPDLSFNISVSFEVPEVMRENSVVDETINNVETAPDTITYPIVETGTQMGRSKLVDSLGYTYNVKRQRKASTDWQCAVRNKTMVCSAVVKEISETFTAGKTTHNHAVLPVTLVTVQMTAQVKQQAVSSVHRPASTIVESAYVQHTNPDLPEGSRLKKSNLVRTCNSVRQKLRQEDPHNLDIEVKQQAVSSVHRPASTIVDSAYVQHANPDLPEGSRPKKSNLVRTCNRVRQKLRQEDPYNLDFEGY